LVFAWSLVFIVFKFSKKKPERIKKDVPENTINVTVEDMILHDMENTDDVYDIGKIDLNE